jgi:hypothetical protein
MHCARRPSDEQKARNVDYYERATGRDSSLSACTQALLCADVGHLELAHDYLHEALLVDLRNLHHNTGDGMHLASLAGGWSALVEGFGGLRVVGEGLTVDPQLPEGLTRLDYRVRWRGQRLLVEVRADVVRVTARDVGGGEVALRLVGEDVTVGPGSTVERPWQRRTPLLPRPEQPPGRARCSARTSRARAEGACSCPAALRSAARPALSRVRRPARSCPSAGRLRRRSGSPRRRCWTPSC